MSHKTIWILGFVASGVVLTGTVGPWAGDWTVSAICTDGDGMITLIAAIVATVPLW